VKLENKDAEQLIEINPRLEERTALHKSAAALKERDELSSGVLGLENKQDSPKREES